MYLFFCRILHLDSISSRFLSPAVGPPPNVVWAKDRGLTKRLQMEPIARADYRINLNAVKLVRKVDGTKQCGPFVVYNTDIENCLAT